MSDSCFDTGKTPAQAFECMKGGAGAAFDAVRNSFGIVFSTPASATIGDWMVVGCIVFGGLGVLGAVGSGQPPSPYTLPTPPRPSRPADTNPWLGVLFMSLFCTLIMLGSAGPIFLDGPERRGTWTDWIVLAASTAALIATWVRATIWTVRRKRIRPETSPR